MKLTPANVLLPVVTAIGGGVMGYAVGRVRRVAMDPVFESMSSRLGFFYRQPDGTFLQLYGVPVYSIKAGAEQMYVMPAGSSIYQNVWVLNTRMDKGVNDGFYEMHWHMRPTESESRLVLYVASVLENMSVSLDGVEISKITGRGVWSKSWLVSNIPALGMGATVAIKR